MCHDSNTSMCWNRRSLLSASIAAALSAGIPLPLAQAAEGADGLVGVAPLPLAVPHVPLTPQLSISQVIKGCWQLSGGHKGEKETDRTAAAAAVQVRQACSLIVAPTQPFTNQARCQGEK